MSKETRLMQGEFEVREGDSGPMLAGYAAVFEKNSEDMGGFIERIAPGAFDEVMQDDVRALFNHDRNMILGRTMAGTLRLSVDESGLAYEVDLPDTQLARDLAVSVGRGDVSQSSFAFTVAAGGAMWEEPAEENGLWTRTITKMGRLFDVAPVTYPAYPDATVALRSLEEHRKQFTNSLAIEREHRERSLSLINLR